MGDVFNDGDKDENPPHNVCVSDFYLGKYELTVGQYKMFVEGTGYQTDAEKKGWGWSLKTSIEDAEKRVGASWINPGFPQNDNHPVVLVTWNDAAAFVKWLSSKSGKVYRLPTEAEWEYAARSGGKMLKYSWGMGRPSGNVADKSAKKEFSGWSVWLGYDDGYVYTAPVGKFKANKLGFHDMSGNVWEWVQDWYDEKYYFKSPKQDPKGPSTGKLRILRGGAWINEPRNLRTANRYGANPDSWVNFAGFRIALSVK
jgi:formylglycine-generating enzyme required for sulfatase activity|tara:strand:+ start:137 stop:904 length:768 start_codon:yes stop_codon:yes gene_type:complete